ncbi:MAG: uridine phosphorylase [Bryobacterales bacterium]|nr:uridine phosphorylase [Bryobacterales bacterium]
MPSPTQLPLFEHDLAAPSEFTAISLMESVRILRNMPEEQVPPICLLEFDGDLTDWLVRHDLAKSFPSWPCFHTTMYSVDAGGATCGLVARTIGGPYAVLIAEQLFAAGARLIVGLTSAGRVAPSLPLPCIVVASAAVRDEGTSYHYLPPAERVECPTAVGSFLVSELQGLNFVVREGLVWTTDAPYRETATQLRHWADQGVLAVEMQAASLFAFAAARAANIAVVARVSNAADHQGDQFDTGTHQDGLRMVEAIVRAGERFLRARGTA